MLDGMSDSIQGSRIENLHSREVDRQSPTGLILLYCCLLGPLLCIVSFLWYMFCLLVVLVKSSLLAKQLARKTPLRKPNRGEEIVSTKPRPKKVYDCLGLVYCFIV